MPLLPRKGQFFSHEERTAKSANLRQIEVLITPLFGSEDDRDGCCVVGRSVWESAARPGRPIPLDLDAWIWFRNAATDGYRLNEHVTTGKIALFTDSWHRLVIRDPSVEPATGLRAPPADVAVEIFAAALSSLLQLDARYPLFVQRNAIYHVPAVTALLAERLLDLDSRGVSVDPATFRLAQTVAQR